MAKAKDDKPKEELDRTGLLFKQIKEMVQDKASYVHTRPGIFGWNSSGSLTLDYHIGQSMSRLGFPQGRVVDLHGGYGSGKTGLALETGAQCQQEGGLVVLITCEGLDDVYAVTVCGLDITDPNKFIMLGTWSLEGMWGLLESTVIQFHKADFPVVIIVDSVSGLGTKSQDLHNKDAEDSTPSADGAKFLHGAFRRGIMGYLCKSKITVFLIRHAISGVRPGQSGGPTHGKAIDYWSDVRLLLYKSAMEKEDGEYAGHYRNIKCVKSKVGVGGWSLSQPMATGVGLDPGKELFTYLKNAKALERKGAYYVIGGESKYQRDWLQIYRDQPEWREWFDAYALSVLQSKF